MNTSNFLIYKEEVCLDQESGRTHGKSSPGSEQTNAIGVDDTSDDRDRELRDEGDDQALLFDPLQGQIPPSVQIDPVGATPSIQDNITLGRGGNQQNYRSRPNQDTLKLIRSFISWLGFYLCYGRKDSKSRNRTGSPGST